MGDEPERDVVTRRASRARAREAEQYPRHKRMFHRAARPDSCIPHAAASVWSTFPCARRSHSGAAMSCLAVLFALMVPRVTIACLWFFTTWFLGIFDTLLWPILGVLFAPFTLLWYSAVHNWWGGHWGLWQIVGLVVAILFDLSPSRAKRK